MHFRNLNDPIGLRGEGGNGVGSAKKRESEEEHRRTMQGGADMAIVSNSSALLGSRLGPRIDRHACVVRFNNHSTGEFD